MAGRLAGKVALITGGSRGIGSAIAEACAREGARVVIVSRKAEPLAAEAARLSALTGGAVLARPCHVGDVAAIGGLIAWAEAEVGVPDVVVSNAGTNPYFGPLLGVDFGAWDKTFEVNLKGGFEMLRQVAKRLIAQARPGSFINVASVAGLKAAPLQGVYGMSKAALISMTQTLAVELGAARIRVNAIAPGLVDTRLAQALTSNPELARHFTERSPLGRYAQPAEIAGLAVYLASDESSFVTGQVYAVDGGYTTA